MKLVQPPQFPDTDLLHLKGCGLDNAYLRTGYNFNSDRTAYSINDVQSLYFCIALLLVDNRVEMNNIKEHRFLTKVIQNHVSLLHWSYEICDNGDYIFTHGGEIK